MIKFFVIVGVLGGVIAAFGNELTLPMRPDDAPEIVQQSHLLSREQFVTTNLPQSSIEIDETELLANPKLLEQLMYSVLLNQHIEGIRIVLPLYEVTPSANPQWIKYGHALLLASNGDFTGAILRYRQILAVSPELSVIRLNLIMALLANQQYIDAHQQLNKINKKKLSALQKQKLDELIGYYRQQNDWQINFNGYFRHESNINNVPEQSQIPWGDGLLVFPEKESARGLSFEVGASKLFGLKNHHYNLISLNIDGNYYWNKKQYNDLSLRLGVGAGYRTAHTNLLFQPFIKQHYYSNKLYSNTLGIAHRGNHLLSPQFQLNWQGTLEYEKHKKFKNLDGNRFFLNLSTTYLKSQSQSFSFGANYYLNDTKNKESSYERLGAFVGWDRNWNESLSSSAFLSISETNYQGTDIFNVTRKDRTYKAKIALWNKKINYLGFVPKIELSWNKNNSNHFYYQRNEKLINFLVFKDF